MANYIRDMLAYYYNTDSFIQKLWIKSKHIFYVQYLFPKVVSCIR